MNYRQTCPSCREVFIIDGIDKKYKTCPKCKSFNMFKVRPVPVEPEPVDVSHDSEGDSSKIIHEPVDTKTDSPATPQSKSNSSGGNTTDAPSSDVLDDIRILRGSDKNGKSGTKATPTPVTPIVNGSPQPAHTAKALSLKFEGPRLKRQQVVTIRPDMCPLEIGRESYGSEFLGKDTFMGRKHAILRYDDNTWKVYDNNSTNHMMVNNKQISPGVGIALKSGDVIRFGITNEATTARVKVE